MTNENACLPCPSGHMCTRGAVVPVACSPGTAASKVEMDMCDECAAGKYQDERGGTSCKVCPQGSACKAGSMAPVICPAGSFGRVEGLRSTEDCEDAPAGFYAPAGSVKPADCPSWGFCPGRAADSENEEPGSIPIVIRDGQQAEVQSDVVETSYNQTVLQLNLRVELDPGAAFNSTAVRAQVALMLGVPIHTVSLKLNEARRRLQYPLGTLGSHSFTVSIAESSVDNSTVATLAAMWGNRSALQLSLELGINVTSSLPPVIMSQLISQNVTISTLVVVDCPPGFWGVNGECLECARGTYKPDNANWTSCKLCPEGTLQDAGGATSCKPCGPGVYCPEGSSAALLCPAGRFSNASGLAKADECKVCPTGSATPAGATEPALCAPGSFAAAEGMATCERCAAGTFQGVNGATMCALCPRKSWCAKGSSAPTPCTAGTVGSSTGLRLARECSDCNAGFWCSAGGAIPCARGTWSNATGASDQGACRLCPEHSTTSEAATTELASCLCDVGRYLQSETEGSSAICSLCPQPGSQCSTPGTTLVTLRLAPSYWRSGNQSREPRLCPSYGGVAGHQRCIGGEGNATCAGLLSGVYCASCPPDFYLDSGSGCTLCSGLTADSATRIGVLASVLLLLVLMRLGWTCGSAGIRTALIRCVARSSAVVQASGLAAKAKQLIAFHQMATSVQSVFGVTFPREVRSLLHVLSFLSLNVFDLGLPTECMALGSFLQRLLFMLLSPIGLLACMLPVARWQLRKVPVAERGPRALALHVLPTALKVLFVVFPPVSAMAVQAFDCETFDDGEAWLRADFSLRCGSVSEGGQQWTPEYEAVRAIGWVGVLLYAFGVPLLFLGLLMSCRKQLSRREPSTPLSASLSCLCSEYRTRFFYWEVVESLKKLFFVSLLRLAPLVQSAQGGMEQLLVALMVALTLTMCQLSAGPYARPTDNTLSVLSGVAYCFLLLGALTLKLSSIAEELGDQLSDQLQGIFSVSTGPVLLVLFCSILISTVFSIAVTLREAVIDLRQPKLRFTASNGLVHLPLQPGKTHHLFVSHVWGSAQDQARVLRGRLQAIVPGLQVWLDVEDLVDISKLEEAVDAMQTVLVIVSSGCECSAIRTTQMEVLTNSHSDTEPRSDTPCAPNRLHI